MNVVANNLANVNTTGFKRGDAAFEDLIYQNVRQVGAQQSQDTQLPSGFWHRRSPCGNGKGFHKAIFPSLKILWMLLDGRGFLQILQPDGSLAYTRTAVFK